MKTSIRVLQIILITATLLAFSTAATAQCSSGYGCCTDGGGVIDFIRCGDRPSVVSSSAIKNGAGDLECEVEIDWDTTIGCMGSRTLRACWHMADKNATNCIVPDDEQYCQEFSYSGSAGFTTSQIFTSPAPGECKWCYVGIKDITEEVNCGTCTDDCENNTCANYPLIGVDTVCVSF